MEKIKETIINEKIIVVVRKLYGEKLINLAKSLYDGGIRLLELTFDQNDTDCLNKTSTSIKKLNEEFNGKMQFGVGTVLTKTQVDYAKGAGASYIISPNIDTEIVEYTKKQGLISIPGAMTPTEMLLAHNAGADFVKAFPAAQMGLNYMNAVMAPLNHIKFIANGGITVNNLADFMNIGFTAVGVSGYLSDKSLVENENWQSLTKRAKSMVNILKNYK